MRREVLVLGVLLILFQVADGLFTGVAVGRYGLALEGNPAARKLMEDCGLEPTIVFLKVSVCLLVVFTLFLAWICPHARKKATHGMWFLLGAHCVMFYQWLSVVKILFE